jgi:hypothetical protein
VRCGHGGGRRRQGSVVAGVAPYKKRERRGSRRGEEDEEERRGEEGEEEGEGEGEENM